jgi:flagellar biogenesis protein FliO
MDQNLLATGFRMLVALGAVLLVFGVTMMVLKKFQGGKLMKARGGKNTPAKPLEVLAFHSFGPGRGLYLVECLGRKILVGATNANINAISVIEDAFDPEASEASGSFSSSLREKMPAESGRSLKQSLAESLKGISRV